MSQRPRPTRRLGGGCTQRPRATARRQREIHTTRHHTGMIAGGLRVRHEARGGGAHNDASRTLATVARGFFSSSRQTHHATGRRAEGCHPVPRCTLAGAPVHPLAKGVIHEFLSRTLAQGAPAQPWGTSTTGGVKNGPRSTAIARKTTPARHLLPEVTSLRREQPHRQNGRSSGTTRAVHVLPTYRDNTQRWWPGP